MKKINMAILGATGAVGQEMIKVLAERRFPLNTLYLLASARSVGKKVPFGNATVTIEDADTFDFSKTDIVLGAVADDLAKAFAPKIVAAGAVFIDNSNGFRMNADVPLVVPEINPQDAFTHKGIISNPNCSTIITDVAVAAINKLSEITSMVASTYQAVSGAGAGGIDELKTQTADMAEGKAVKCEVFPYQIAENLIPQIGGFDEIGYTSEEMKMQNESRKIMHLPDLDVTCTCVRVPVVRSHSISLVIRTKEPLTTEQVRNEIQNASGCVLYDEPTEKKYPMPTVTSDQDLVYVGRIRQALGENGIALFCCGDQLRKGAATNAIQIAELIIGK